MAVFKKCVHIWRVYIAIRFKKYEIAMNEMTENYAVNLYCNKALKIKTFGRSNRKKIYIGRCMHFPQNVITLMKVAYIGQLVWSYVI
jgi:hypothetical protein